MAGAGLTCEGIVAEGEVSHRQEAKLDGQRARQAVGTQLQLQAAACAAEHTHSLKLPCCCLVQEAAGTASDDVCEERWMPAMRLLVGATL